MGLVHADRVKETTTTTGTGTYSLAGAVAGFRTFVAGVGSGNTCYYVAENGTDWEIGLGTVTDAAPDTLARTRVIKSSNADAAVNWGAGTKNLFVAPIAERRRDIAPLRGYLWNLTLFNDIDTVNDIEVDGGEATDETGEVVMVLGPSLVKQLDAAWAVGSNAGGLNTGVVAANTWYEVHLIMRQDTGVVDAMFTTIANRGTLPAGYTHKRRIGWIRRNSTTILQFAQVDDHFTLLTPINDVAVAKTTTETLVVLTAPPNSVARFRAGVDSTTLANANAVTVFKEDVEDATAPSATTGLGSLGYFDLATCYTSGHFELWVKSTSQIKHDSTVAVGNLDISTYGWIDYRRRLSAFA